MNEDIIEGKWEEIKGKMQQVWAKLTDDDYKKIEGKHTELCGILQQRYGYSKEQAEKVVKDFKDDFNNH